MDRAFGKLRRELRTLGIHENTILWYCSDNGGLPGVGTTGGRGNKGQIYEGGRRGFASRGRRMFRATHPTFIRHLWR